ncbi:MAG TPA: FTR1 family protein [Solirubrobacteraceae bacterium]|nr:FTR1 family protein [Solirubrobacteraceae bacterium]
MASATRKRLGWILLAVAAVGLLVWQLINAGGGTPDPTDPSAHLSHLAVVVDSGILVLREGLETILVLAVLTASMRGTNSVYRRPLALGGVGALGAAVVTWFVAIAVTDAVGPGSLDLQAATGLLAIAVLLVVMNWFFHKVYWTGWIASHNRRRKTLMGEAGSSGAQRALLGLVLLGFTSVYREGFEVVLFLQNLRLRYGSGVVLEGVVMGLLAVAAIGWLTFGLQSKLPYKKMLVATGVMLGVVLLVMVGESVQELQQAGWIGTTPINVAIPGWMGLWFAVFPNVQTIVAQVAAAVLVVGSYFLAEEIRVRRPRRRGGERAVRATAPPVIAARTRRSEARVAAAEPR